jgi:hypothetical protein
METVPVARHLNNTRTFRLLRSNFSVDHFKKNIGFACEQNRDKPVSVFRMPHPA